MSQRAGAALLADVQRRLTLLGEAVTGRCTLIAPIEQLDQRFRKDAFSNDGRHYWLPESIDTNDNFDANYRVYRVALMHQLGYQLHRTFDFRLARFAARYPALAEPETSNTADLLTSRSRVPLLELEKLFASQPEPRVLKLLFATLEAWRIDLQNYRQFPGLRTDLALMMGQALTARPDPGALAGAQASVEALICLTLQPPSFSPDQIGITPGYGWLAELVHPVSAESASVHETSAASLQLHRRLLAAGDLSAITTLLNEPVPATGTSQLPMPANERTMIAPVQFRGDPFAAPAIASRRRIAADANALTGDDAGGQGPHDHSEPEPRASPNHADDTPGLNPDRERFVLIDEWDYLKRQFLRGWCCLHEYRLEGNAGHFRAGLLNRYRDAYERIKRQLNNLPPEAIRLQRGLPDGESIELDRAIERISDRRAGLPGDDRLYQRRERAHRDIAAAFLLDMSASTDFQVPDPLADPDTTEDDPQTPAPTSGLDDIGWSPYDAMELDLPAGGTKRRVIDIAKESLGLISAVLQDLDDRFALYAYSGQGRQRVSFAVAKEFDEVCTARSWGGLAAIEPQGSSRMGAAIRHAGAKLARVVARLRVMIIVSDGYPQDIDYGPERSSDEYGLQDTARAIDDVSRSGVQVFCLSVDPGGHDYLRRLCPAHRYLVIDEVSQLPLQLIKVYRGLTGA